MDTSTVLKRLRSKKTVIFSAWKKTSVLDFLKISRKFCEDFLVSMTSGRPEFFCKKVFLRNFTKQRNSKSDSDTGVFL